MNFLRLIRWPNLLIVALTQFLLYQFILVPFFTTYQLAPALDILHFVLLVITTLLITASGYVINDIVDIDIDKINKPSKNIIKDTISLKQAWTIYKMIVLSGFLIALYLANYVKNIPLVLIYPLAVGLLWQYSFSWKKKLLIGNFIVSAFCAFVAGIVLFAERHTFSELKLQAPEAGQQITLLFTAYLIFAFLSTMYREIIKDIEDVEGDRFNECQTIAVVWGVPKAKKAAAFFGITLLLLLGYWSHLLFQQSLKFHLAYMVIGLLIPLTFTLLKLISAFRKNEFRLLSQVSKFIMLSGILYLFIYRFLT